MYFVLKTPKINLKYFDTFNLNFTFKNTFSWCHVKLWVEGDPPIGRIDLVRSRVFDRYSVSCSQQQHHSRVKMAARRVMLSTRVWVHISFLNLWNLCGSFTDSCVKENYIGESRVVFSSKQARFCLFRTEEMLRLAALTSLWGKSEERLLNVF